MQETMPASYYSQQIPYHYEYYNNIPMGRHSQEITTQVSLQNILQFDLISPLTHLLTTEIDLMIYKDIKIRLFATSALFGTQASAKANQKFLFLFGAPGVGKGTYAKMLRKDLKYNHISTGDEIRKILSGKVSSEFDPKLIETIRSIVQSGGLVSDDIVARIIQ